MDKSVSFPPANLILSHRQNHEEDAGNTGFPFSPQPLIIRILKNIHKDLKRIRINGG
jgi:hypothetical protein